MKRIANRGLALLMAFVMCISLLPALQTHSHAVDVDYVYSNGTDSYIYNWGTRGETATSLSQNAAAFYTGDNSYAELAKLSGGTGTANAPSSALYSALKKLMTDKQTTVTSYNDTRDLFQYTDCQNSGKDSKAISSFYSGLAIGPVWDSGSTWNREHTWPNSKGDASGEGENDIMMLRPTATSENGPRGNKAYGVSSGFYDPNTVSNGNYNLRGDVARIMLYVYTRWGNTVAMWGSDGVIESLDVLLAWMAEDPVDTWELGRNDSVESITGTRNVFVDYPELAFQLFGAEMPSNTITPSNGQGGSGHSHSYTTSVTAPTCTAKGYTTYTCTDPACGFSYKGNYTDMLDHNYENGVCTGCGAAAVVTPTYVTEVSTGTAYKLGLYSTSKSAAYYFKGTMSNYYGATSTAFADGVDVYLEATTGGYYLYFQAADGSKQYINLKSNDTHLNFTYGSTASSVFVWDADKDALRTTVGSEVCYMGTYGSYVTMGVLSTSKLKDTDYIARLYIMPSSGGSTECQHEWLAATCLAPKTCSKCGKTEGEPSDQHSYVNGVCSVCGQADPSLPEEEKVWVKVTDASVLKAGDRIVIVAAAANKGLSTTQNNNNRGADDVTKSGNTVTFGDDVQILELVEGTVTGTFGFKAGQQYLYAASSSSNYLRSSTTHNANSSWAITIDGTSGAATIKAQGANTRNWLRYNSGSTIFSCYSSGQNDVVIYREVSPSSCQHEWVEASCQAPMTCKLCGTTKGNRVPHEYANGKCGVCGKNDPTIPSESWTKVTNASDLKVGDKIIIVANTANKALSTTQNKNNRGAANVTKSGNTVTFSSGVQVIELVTGTVSGTFGFKVGNQYLYAASSSSNYLRSSTTHNANSSWAITIDGTSGAATVKAQGSNTRNWMRYNSSSTIFACYSSGQQDIAIYKQVVSTGECPHDWVDATCDQPKLCLDCRATEGEALGHSWSDATCTLPKTCSVCGETEGEALGHSWNDATCTLPKTCSACGETEGEALGHNYIAQMTTKPGCQNKGLCTYTCNGCGDSYTKELPATGHSLKDGVCTSCGDILMLPQEKDPAETCDGAQGCPLHRFSDLNSGEWYHTGVHYCVEKGLLQGMPDNSFAPYAETTRAQIVTILWRLEGCPVVSYAMDFEDVDAGQWYTEAIRWAAANNIVGGYGNGSFGTDDAITREQLATTLYRYAKYKGLDVSGDGSLEGFADAAQIHDYALYALQWACGEGLIQGIADGNALLLDPAASANRAQVATILYRYCEKVAK